MPHPSRQKDLARLPVTAVTGVESSADMSDDDSGPKLLKWEYTWFHSEGSDALNELMRKANSLGEQGWEMVNFGVDEQRPYTAVSFFKRPLQPEKEIRRRYI